MSTNASVIRHGSHGGYTATGPAAIELVALIHLKAALNLEIKCPGLRMSRRMSALAAAKRWTGLSTNDRTKHLERIEEMLAEVNTRVVHVTDTDGEQL